MARYSVARSWIALPFVFGVAACVGAMLSLFVFGPMHVAFPVSALCSVAVLALSSRLARNTFPVDPRRALGHALSASAIVPTLGFGIWVMHTDEVWVRSTPDASNGAVIWFTFLAFILALPAGVAAVEWVGARLRRPLRVALLTPLALAVVALALVGLVRGASLPQVASPLSALPVVANLRAPLHGGASHYHSLGSSTLFLGCTPWDPSECQVLLRRNAVDPLPAGWPSSAYEHAENVATPYSVPPAAVIQVRRDQRHDLWIVEQVLRSGRTRAFAAFRGADLARVNVSMRDFPGDFAPPFGWSIVALLGVALAFGIVRRARYAEPPTALAPPKASAVEGAHYRDAAAGPDLIDVAERWREVQTALACSTLVLAGTPLAVAAWLRLLG